MRATFFDGRIARAHPVDLTIDGDVLVLTGDGIERRHVLGSVEIPEAPGSTPRVLRFIDGSSCEVMNGDELSQLLASHGIAPDRVSAWERSYKLALVSLMVVLTTGVLFYQFGLPMLARAAANKLPPGALDILSRQVQTVLDRTGFSPSTLPLQRRAEITRKFYDLNLPEFLSNHLILEFRHADSIGANAMALPSGTIFVTDDLVGLTTDDRIILAVIAHEAGHVDKRHGLRKIIQSSTVGILVTWYLGDISAIGAAAPAALLNAKYSRDLEHEADAYAADVLRANGLPVTLLADALELLEKSRGRSGKGEGASYLSSHPPTAERLQWLKSLR